jgi:hypothetical protein
MDKGFYISLTVEKNYGNIINNERRECSYLQMSG